MQLPFLKKTTPERSFFLSLLVKPRKVGTILFEEVDDKLLILANHETPLATDAENLSGEELLHAADKTISFTESSLPEGASVDKTIFSLPYDWIIDSKIKPEYLDRLKSVCKSLGLTPIGYLTSIEAIVHFIDKNEGAPASAIFLEITRERVFAYLVRAGKILEFYSGVVNGNVVSTTEELLSKMESVDVLPAKIILLDYDNAARMQQEFLSHKWPSSIPFLHVPQVVVLEKGFENEATINGVATQMELEVSSEVKTREDEVAPEEVLEETTGEEFGFLKEEDVAKSEVEKQKTEDGEDSAETETPESLDENVKSVSFEEEPDIKYFKQSEENKALATREDAEEMDEPSRLKLPAFLASVLPMLENLKLPKFKLPSIGSPSKAVPSAGAPASSPISFASNLPKSKLILIAGAVVLFLVVFSYVYYSLILHAQVIIFADKKAVDKTVNISFTKDATSADSIKLTVTSEEVSGNETKNATGSKQTGDKATGSVTIYNKTENEKTYLKGATITGPNSLQFVLADDVNVASTSSFSTTLSSANVKIQAAQFGKQYNLPSGSNFTLDNVSPSEAIAKNSDAISGGTSKTTTVVSSKDLSDLLNLVTEKLQGDAQAKAQSALSSDQVALPQPLSADVKSKSFTKKENDEAGTVGITATIDYNIGTYNKSDLDNFVKNSSKSDVPGTYVLQESGSKEDITDIKAGSDGQSASATLKINSIYTPQIDPSSLSAKIAGKSQGSVDTQIRNTTGVTDVNITLVHKLPLFPSFLPFNSKNIDIQIKD